MRGHLSGAAKPLRSLIRAVAGLQLLVLPLAFAVAFATVHPVSRLHARIESWLLDADQHLLATDQHFDNTVVVEIDEASMAELQPYFGKWPYDRSTYALLQDYLGEMQVRAVFFDVLFADARGGDEQFKASLVRTPQAILAASALRQAIPQESDDATLTRLAWPRSGEAVPEATHWPALALPLPLLKGAEPLPQIGVITFNYDDDGVLRRVPMLHEVGGQYLPSAVLAALRPDGASLGVAREEDGLRIGDTTWPVDKQGSVGLIYPANRNSVLTMPLSQLAKAALGHADARINQDFFRGKTVFIGSTTLFADHVNTPHGIMNGIHVLAIAFATMSQGRFLAPPSMGWNGLLMLIAVLPALLILIGERRRLLPSLSPLHMPSVAVSCILSIYGLHLALLAARQPTELTAPLLAALTCGVLTTLHLLRQSRHDAHAAAQAATEAADARVAKQQEMVAMVSHELKTPLAIIDLTLQNLSMVNEDLPAPVIARHQKLRRASRRLQALIQHHLAEDRLRQNSQLHSDVFDLAPIIEEIAEAAEYSELTVDLLEAEDLTVNGDKEMLRVALSNLVGNAVKYSPDGGSIHIVAKTDDNTLRVQIIDHGIGIEADTLPRIFDPYFRAYGVHQPGSGLGLNLVKTIIEKHQGMISADSKAGAGSVFTVTLPLAKTN